MVAGIASKTAVNVTRATLGGDHEHRLSSVVEGFQFVFAAHEGMENPSKVKGMGGAFLAVFDRHFRSIISKITVINNKNKNVI